MTIPADISRLSSHAHSWRDNGVRAASSAASGGLGGYASAPWRTAAPGPRADRRRGGRHRVDPRAGAEPPRAGHVRGDVVRALLLQVVARSTSSGCPTEGEARARRARARTPAWSTSATASPPPSASRATTTRRPSSPTRARPPASAASSATSSPWAPGRSPSWTRCASARSTTPAAAGSPRASCPASPATATRSACPPSAARSSSTRPTPGNPLVNVLCLGVLPTERLVLGQASGVGNLAVLLGSSTGRDGIGGVSVLASAGLRRGDRRGQAPDASRSATRSRRSGSSRRASTLLDAGLVVGIQDLGGAGLTCATSETASRGGVGMDVDVDRRPPSGAGHGAVRGDDQRVPGADAGHRRARATSTRCCAICARWEVRADGRRPGRPRAGGCRILDGFDGEVLADVPASSLHDAAPLYDRPLAPAADRAGRRRRRRRPRPRRLRRRPARPARRHRRGCARQYDHQLFLNTVEGPGGDATVLRLKHPTTGAGHRAGAWPSPPTATTAGARSTPGRARPWSWPSRCSTWPASAPGRSPLVNCLNFGNPEHPEVMWQLSEAIDGMGEACRAFGIPVVGGNVSLYNESEGADIDPTPVVGMLGLVDDLDRAPARRRPGRRRPPRPARRTEPDGLGGSRWARATGRPGSGDAAAARPAAAHRRRRRRAGAWSSTGVVAACTTWPAAASAWPWPRWPCPPASGFTVAGVADHAALFSEAPSRVVVCVARRP